MVVVVVVVLLVLLLLLLLLLLVVVTLVVSPNAQSTADRVSVLQKEGGGGRERGERGGEGCVRK